MSLRGMLTQSVTVERRTDGTEDIYGIPVSEWTPSAAYPARLEQRSGLELTTDRNTQIGDWLLFLPPEAEITGEDRVTWDGNTYEVTGPPVVARTPRGSHHIEATLRLVVP